MESKLNSLAIDTYTSAFSDRVANDFFARHEKINGEQILKLSPVQQVNLFVIKNLFTAWQQESYRLRSPFFNYQNPKVQEAQKVYLNTLSRHISIAEGNLKPLLKEAVRDSLILLFAPISYLRKALAPTEGKPEAVDELLRYVRINQAYAKEARNILNRQDVNDQQWMEKLEQALVEQEKAGHLKPEALPPYLQQFNQVLALHPAEFLVDEELQSRKEEEENTDFFSSVTGSLEEKGIEPAQPEIQQSHKAAPAPDENLPSAADIAPRHAQLRREEPDVSNKSPQISISRPAAANENKQPTLNDRLSSQQRSLNQSLTAPAEKPSRSVADTRKKSGSIRSSITLNHRFMFANELFKGDTQAFNEALDELDRFNNYQEARDYAIRQYGSRYNWNLEGEAAQEFLQILENRFS